ncbi:MAG: hypothetical protein GX912_12500, partial [Gammaproteobacteria bacterium]|nr:hypothetical protein [Gammaproteobacteria bacterium]
MEMLADWATKAESMLATLENKTDLTGDHKGTWQGLKPTQTDIGLQATVEDNQNKINIISLFPNSMDSTNNIQQFLDTIPDNSVVRLPPGNYTVEKNDLLAGFPLNDQPCLLLRNKNNVIIDGHGVVLETENHAQGILELHDCNNVYIRGLTLRGCGSYPALDGNTGRGEKGT